MTTPAHIKLAFAGLFDGDEFDVELTDPLHQMTIVRCDYLEQTSLRFQSSIRQLTISRYAKPIDFCMSDFIYDFDFDGDCIEIDIIGDLIGQVSLSDCLLNHSQVEFALNFSRKSLENLNRTKSLVINNHSVVMEDLNIQFSPKLVIAPSVVAKLLVDVLIDNGLDHLQRIGVIRVYANGQPVDVSANIEYFETFRRALKSHHSFYFGNVLRQIEHIKSFARLNDKQIKKVEKAACELIKNYLQVSIKMGLGRIQLQSNCSVKQSILKR